MLSTNGATRAAPSTAGQTAVSVFVSVFIVLLAFVGVAALAGSFLSFDMLRTKILSMSAIGQIAFFTAQFYLAMQVRLRVIGAIYIAAAAVALFFRPWIRRTLMPVFRDSFLFYRDIRAGLNMVPGIDRWLLSIVALFAGYLRVRYLSQPMLYDESYTFLQYASHPYYAALSFYDAPNNHLLHTLLVRASYLLFGNHPWALRLPAFLAGLFLVPASYVASRILYPKVSGLLASGLVASSSTLIEYSANARGYTILTLIFLLLIPLIAYAVERKNFAAWLLTALLIALGFYAIPIMLYPLCGLILWTLLNKKAWQERPTMLVALCTAALFTAVLYSPVLAVSGPASVFENRFVAPQSLPVFLHELPPSLASTWKEWNRDWPAVLVIILGASFFGSLLFIRNENSFRVPLALCLLISTAPLLLAQRVVPFERVWLFAVPLYLITSASGLVVLIQFAGKRSGWPYTTALVAIAITSVLGIRIHRSDAIRALNYGRGLERITSYLKQELRPGDSVACRTISWPSLRYYFYSEGVPLTYVEAPNPKRLFVVLNDVTQDTLPEVLSETSIANQATLSGRLLLRVDSAVVYQIILPDTQ